MDTFCLLAQDTTSVQPVGGFLVLVIVFMILVIAATVFWLWMLIDALTLEPTTNDKILWFLVIFFLHFIGALVYFVVRRSHRSAAIR